jgi:hypothetical protein
MPRRGVIKSELLRWLKAQPLVGRAVRTKRVILVVGLTFNFTKLANSLELP